MSAEEKWIAGCSANDYWLFLEEWEPDDEFPEFDINWILDNARFYSEWYECSSYDEYLRKTGQEEDTYVFEIWKSWEDQDSYRSDLKVIYKTEMSERGVWEITHNN